MRLHGEELEVCTIRDMVVARAANGDRPLVHLRDETLTYADAHLRSNRYANALTELGVGAGDVVTTFLFNSIDQILLWFACAKLGAIWAPLNISLRREDLRFCINDTGARVLIVDQEVLAHFQQIRDGLPNVRSALLWGDAAMAEQEGMLPFHVLQRGDDRTPDIRVSANDAVSLTYTSGSTAAPKGAVLPNLAHLAAALRFRDYAQIRPGDIHYENGPLFHIGGQQMGVIGTMYCNITSVMTKWFSASRYWELARRHRATTCHLTGMLIAALLKQPERPDDRDHTMRVAVAVGSGQIRPELRDAFEDRFGLVLLEAYGSTELGSMICSQTLNDRRRGSCGKPRGWAEMRIVGDDCQTLPPDQVGQVLVRPSELLTFVLEYHRKPLETIKAWHDLWFHTGDLGRLDEDGNFYFAGRQANWIRRRGENISSLEVEGVIATHPAVADCAVFGVPSDMADEDVKTCVQLKEGVAALDPLEIVQWCEARIAYFKVPRYVEFVSGFTRSASKQEIERHKLRAQGVANAWDRERAGYVVKRS